MVSITPDFCVNVSDIKALKVVDEKSTCIDGHRKVSTYHMKINNFSGEDDSSYQIIYAIIMEISQGASEKVKRRLKRMLLLLHVWSLFFY